MKLETFGNAFKSEIELPKARQQRQKLLKLTEKYWQYTKKGYVQSKLSNTDTEGTERSVRIREVSV